jgi:DNA helicase II / ATP-dependent DNA helicase PcrA
MFLAEMPEELLERNVKAKLPRMGSKILGKEQPAQKTKPSYQQPSGNTILDWSVGEKLVHEAFGVGQVTHIFGTGQKLCLAVKFPGSGQKIIDPKLVALKRVE